MARNRSAWFALASLVVALGLSVCDREESSSAASVTSNAALSPEDGRRKIEAPTEEALRGALESRIEAEGGPTVSDPIPVGSGMAEPTAPASHETGPQAQSQEDAEHAVTRAFYQSRDWRPVWLGPRGLAPVGVSLLEALASASTEGLPDGRYRAGELEAAVRAVYNADKVSPSSLADLELRLTQDFFQYARDSLVGVTDPADVAPAWRITRPQPDLIGVLQQVVAQGDVTGGLAQARPPMPAVKQLTGTLERYRAVARAGGWPPVPGGPTLTAGARDPRVARLQLRLEQSGDLEPGTPATDVYEGAVVEAVRHFQRRHGLLEDGVLGDRTLVALNVPVERRIEALEVNLERLRWLPPLPESKRIEVNIPDFRLQVLEADAPILSMAVVVGKVDGGLATPVFASQVQYVVFNPYWNVPRSIVDREILPQVLADPSYLATHGYEIVTTLGPDAQVIDPATIPRDLMAPGAFLYRIRQKPGPANALGSMKFVFPNPYQVYLHDTPQREYFSSRVRAFSHGCIRVENPVGLAELLLRDAPDWDRARILQATRAGRPWRVPLPEAVPIYVLYLTAFAMDDGVHFRQDIYGQDASILAGLRQAGALEAGTVG